MRWSLLWCNLMTVLVSSLAVVEYQVDSAEEPVEPVEPVETVEEQDRILDQETTPANKASFYEPGTDFYAIPELYRHIKAGKNTSGLYKGPTFNKEFMIKTPSGKRVTTGFKLLDWKRRRKRLDRKGEKRHPNSIKTGDRIKKECPGTKDKAVTGSEDTTNSNFKRNSNTQESVNEHERKNKCALKSCVKEKNDNALPIDNNTESDNDDGEMKRGDTKVYTQPCYDENDICSNPLSDNDAMLTRLSERSLKFYNESESRKRRRRNKCLRKRPKRDEKSSLRDLVAYDRTTRVKIGTEDSSNSEIISHTASSPATTCQTSKTTFKEESVTSTEKSVKPTEKPAKSTEEPIKQTEKSVKPTEDSLKPTTTMFQPTFSELLKTELTTEKREPFTVSITKKEVQPKNEVNKANKDYKEILTSQTKAKIIINGEEMPVHDQQKPEAQMEEPQQVHEQTKLKLNPEEQQVHEELKQKLTSEEMQVHDSTKQKSDHNAAVIFCCVTPPPPTTGNSLKEMEEQRAECHPKGSGPLSPMSFDPEAYGPRNEEEVEDALTGKLADRVVEVVMAKVGKAPRMLKELGLYAQGNLTKIQCTISHPEGKQACKEQSSEALKQTVLQDIATAVEKLASTKSNGMCLKPPEDLADFLSWLLSEDSEMDMPEPNSHVSLQPRREADYLFRSNGVVDDFFNDIKDIDHKCNWDSWMSFVEESPENAISDKSPVTEEFEGKGHVKQEKNFKRMPRHLLHRKRVMKKPGEHGRRRRYTPWSLNDYP